MFRVFLGFFLLGSEIAVYATLYHLALGRVVTATEALGAFSFCVGLSREAWLRLLPEPPAPPSDGISPPSTRAPLSHRAARLARRALTYAPAPLLVLFWALHLLPPRSSASA